MNVWLVLLLGIIIGWIVGIIIVRLNSQTCSDQIELLKKELMENDTKLRDAASALDDLTQQMENKEAQLESITHQ